MPADMTKLWGSHEQSHVDALTKAVSDMGGKPVGSATYTFPAGMLTGQADTFRFLANVETIGVGAYTGAANKLQDKNLLAVAGSIVQVAARHAALSRLLSGDKKPIPPRSARSSRRMKWRTDQTVRRVIMAGGNHREEALWQTSKTISIS